ncbi:MAG: SpoIID/LytB domain-containing protein [Clostridiaceae bacterium]|jgi:stage II sporulation protein D|nr:SpoIID/LytB domain-containing protein [Clostridia bacterium]NLV33455.1 SpoIID/LytB domain-containing protein [Clostridiaceae bacterium]
MNRKKRQRISIVLAIISLICFSCVNVANAVIYAPLYLQVGLYFGDTAKSAYTISSPFGLNMTININNQEIDFASTQNTLVVAKDTGEYSYHIIRDDNYTSYTEALDVSNSMSLAGATSFPVYAASGFWQVWLGSYASSDSAMNAIASVAAKYPGSYSTIAYPSSSRILVRDKASSRILFACDNPSAPVIAKTITTSNSSYMYIEGKPYRGNLEFTIFKSNELSVLNNLILEYYVYGVVALEIGSNSPMESLKAQAVVARTYALCQNKHQEYGFDVCATTCCQVYGGYNAENYRTNQATNETYGQVVTYSGQVVTPYYFSSSGGYTENSENVWVTSVPYLKAVVDAYDINRIWSYSYTTAQMTDYMYKLGHRIGNVIKVTIDSSSHTGRVLSMTVNGSTGSVTFLKSNVRNAFPDFLPSQMFVLGGQSTVKIANASGAATTQALDYASIRGIYNTSLITSKSIGVKTNSGIVTVSLVTDDSNDKITVSGRGSGHGVGMAQWGAINMADAGYTYDQIIRYFYTGVKLESVTLR